MEKYKSMRSDEKLEEIKTCRVAKLGDQAKGKLVQCNRGRLVRS